LVTSIEPEPTAISSSVQLSGRRKSDFGCFLRLKLIFFMSSFTNKRLTATTSLQAAASATGSRLPFDRRLLRLPLQKR
jgi:hypothetical protein